MPELPEVETVCRQLEPELDGRRIELLEVLDARWCASGARPPSWAPRSAGARSRGLAGAASTCCSASDGGQTLVMHLRMTGNLVLVEGEDVLDPSEGRRLYEAERSTSERHLRARFVLDDGRELWFTDPRRFGEVFLIDDADVGRASSGSGSSRSPRSSRRRRWARWQPGRTAPLKSFLLDQARVAGVGNIYADEALFRARLHPLSPAGSMKPEHHEALRDAVVAALEAGIDGGGASIDDYRDGRGERGHDAGRVPRPHPRGQALSRLRRPDRADRRQRPLDLLLPELPGAPAPPRRAVAVRPVGQL